MLDKLTQFTGGLQERLQTYGLPHEKVIGLVIFRKEKRVSAASNGLRILLQTEGSAVQGEIPAPVSIAPPAELPVEEQPRLTNFHLVNAEPEIHEGAKSEAQQRADEARRMAEQARALQEQRPAG